jgi:hypothetical protein
MFGHFEDSEYFKHITCLDFVLRFVCVPGFMYSIHEVYTTCDRLGPICTLHVYYRRQQLSYMHWVGSPVFTMSDPHECTPQLLM